MRKWKTAFQASLGYAEMKSGEVIKSLSGLEYEGIEWTTSHFNPDKPLGELKQLVEQTRDAGMEVTRIMAHEDLVSLDDIARNEKIDSTVRIIEAAGACGVATVGTMTGPAPWDPEAPRVGVDISEGAAWDQVFEAYEAFTAAAHKAGVTITSEGVFGMLAHDFYTHRYLMDHLDTSVNKVNFDPSHGILYGNLDVGWIVRQWGDLISHVHLKDAIGIPEIGKFVFPLLGEGLVNWIVLFAALDDINYTGFCSVEFESFDYYKNVLKSNPEAAARISIEAIESITQGFA